MVNNNASESTEQTKRLNDGTNVSIRKWYHDLLDKEVYQLVIRDDSGEFRLPIDAAKGTREQVQELFASISEADTGESLWDRFSKHELYRAH